MESKLGPKAHELIFIFNEQKLLILKELTSCRTDVCGCDLVASVNISKDLLSYHIKTLKEKGYIEEIRCGRHKQYVISPEKADLVDKILKLAELI